MKFERCMFISCGIFWAKQKRGKKNVPADNTNYPFWDEYRQKLMIQMNRLLKCPIEKLWPHATNFFRYAKDYSL